MTDTGQILGVWRLASDRQCWNQAKQSLRNCRVSAEKVLCEPIFAEYLRRRHFQMRQINDSHIPTGHGGNRN
jgi:hypothetical protein